MSVVEEAVIPESPPKAEVAFLDVVHTTGNDKALTRVVEQMVGRAVEALDDHQTTNAARRKLLGDAIANVGLLTDTLTDTSIKKETRAKLLLKALEIGIRVPASTIQAEGEALTIRVKTG